MNVKIPTIVGILTFMSRINFSKTQHIQRKYLFLGRNCLEQSSLKYKEFAIFRYINENMYQLDERLNVKSSLKGVC